MFANNLCAHLANTLQMHLQILVWLGAGSYSGSRNIERHRFHYHVGGAWFADHIPSAGPHLPQTGHNGQDLPCSFPPAGKDD